MLKNILDFDLNFERTLKKIKATNVMKRTM